jgi:DNA-binding NarL/FixJ family response regulator
VSIRVVIADDQAMVRKGFRLLLEDEPDIEVVGEAADGHEAIAAARRLRPDVALMDDIRMPNLDGLEATRRLLAGSEAPTRVLILTTFELSEYVYEALRAGASGFLIKDAPAEQLIDAIRIVAAGDALLAPSVTRRVIEEFARLPAPSPDRPPALEALTAREIEVLRLVAKGLVLSGTTVKTHVSHLLMKLDLRDRVQAVVFAYETGLVQRRGSVH